MSVNNGYNIKMELSTIL